MSSQQSGLLLNVYRKRIGTPGDRQEVYGYWLFVIGLVASVLGILRLSPARVAPR